VGQFSQGGAAEWPGKIKITKKIRRGPLN